MNETRSFVDKLGLRPGQSICLLDAPQEFIDERLAGALDGCRVDRALGGQGQTDLIIVWPQGENGLPDLFQRLRASVAPDGAVWVVIPKGKAARRGDIGLGFEGVQRAALPTGLVDNKVLSFGDDEYGVRFVARRTERSKEP